MSSILSENADWDEKRWPTLVPLDSPNLSRLDPKCIPGWAGEFVCALSDATETPPELAAGMVLASCATASARRLKVEVLPGYFETSNLWVLPALPSGNRKSAVQSAASEPLREWEREQAEVLGPEIKRIESERKTLEARAKEFRNLAIKAKKDGEFNRLSQAAADLEAGLPGIPVVPQLWTSDATPERLGILMADHGESMAWLSSEGGVFDLLQGRYSNGIPNLDLMLKSHSGDSERVDRAGRPSVYLSCPRLTIGLSPQPDVLRGLATKPGFRGRGLLARFLYLLPPSPLGYRILKTTPVPARVSRKYADGLRAMLNWEQASDERGRPELHLLRLDKEALAQWESFGHAIEIQMRSGGDLEHFTDWAGKAPGAAARVAGVMHAIKLAHGRPWDKPISADTMRDAIQFMEVVTQHSLAALDMMGADPSIAAARQLWNWIERKRQPRFTAREAFNALRSAFPHMEKLNDALGVLAERGYVEVIEPPKERVGRPPSPVVAVNPEVYRGWR